MRTAPQHSAALHSVRRRQVAVVLTLAATAALLPWTGSATSAQAATAARSATAVRATTSATTAQVAVAPAIPGANRFTGKVPAATREVIVVSAPAWGSLRSKITLYERSGTGWRTVVWDKTWLGYGGLVQAAKRKQDTGTTPAGLFSISQAFGRKANPGTRLPYTKVNNSQWWVEDRNSRYYNQMRNASQGGFALQTTGPNSSEHLYAMGYQYDYVAVINFNRPNPVIGRGSGIFLHVTTNGPTGGCVATARATMITIMKHLKPGLNPMIIIGPSSWLTSRT
jgi:L,D-peptidoglycan transpeptidase YkuD (ErfK/YbiS/YcfS/YnhG family)